MTDFHQSKNHTKLIFVCFHNTASTERSYYGIFLSLNHAIRRKLLPRYAGAKTDIAASQTAENAAELGTVLWSSVTILLAGLATRFEKFCE